MSRAGHLRRSMECLDYHERKEHLWDVLVFEVEILLKELEKFEMEKQEEKLIKRVKKALKRIEDFDYKEASR